MRLRAACALLVLSASGCGLFGKGGEPTPAPIEIVVTGSRYLNPDQASGDSLSTRVRVFQLKRKAAFESAGYEQVYSGVKEALGEDLLQVDEFWLDPGAVERRRVERDKAARALAVVAVVRQPTGSTWREVVDLPAPDKATRFSFAVEGYQLQRRPAEERR